MNGPGSANIARFEGFRFDRAAGCLYRVNDPGVAEPVALGSRALALLAVLVERQGQLVSKDEIVKMVWPGIAVAEANLTVQVSALRRVLDRDREQGSCIRTISGRGYCFVAPVTGVEAAIALGAPRTPLIGREEELALLQRRWRQAKAGEGAIVLVSGEPGIGKSRLAQSLLDKLSGEPHTRLRLFCSPHHQDHALYPTIAQLERAAGFRREDRTEARLDKLEAVLARATNDLDEALPLLAALLSLPTGERYPPLGLAPQQQKEKTLRALVAQVEGLAARQPVLLLFEDAQWSDPTSLELLDLIVDRAPALSLLLVVTSRPDFTPPWASRPHVGRLGLKRLAPRQRAEMIAGVTGGKVLPRELAEHIARRTDGVPLSVEELTRAVVESGMLTDAGDHYTAAAPITPLAVPTTLQEALLARLDRLAPVREVAQIGAALGPLFSHELIGAVAPIPQRQLDDALAQLVGAKLIHRRGTPPDAVYSFKHALVQDAAYSTLLRGRRQQLHGRIAATLEDRFPEIVAAQPALLAHHCEEAGLTEKAVEYWLAAGQHAWARSATAEAVALLRRGLALVPGSPDADWRRERELDLQLALGQALAASRGWGAPDLVEAHSRAQELAAMLNRPRALLFARFGQFMDHWARLDLKRARRVAKEMRELGRIAGDLPMRVMGCEADGLMGFNLGEFVTARACFEKALSLYDSAHRPYFAELLPHDARVTARTNLSWSLACLGHIDQALLQRDAALDEARWLSHPATLALALGPAAWMTGWLVRLESRVLLEYADETLALATEHGLGFYRAMALLWRGWCLAALGRAGEGIPLLTGGTADLEESGFVLWRPWRLALLGDAYRMAGRRQAALEHLTEGQRWAEETGALWFQAETLRRRADVLLEMGDRTEPEAGYCEAIEIAQQQSAKLWELCAATSLARLWRDQGKRVKARDVLAPVYGWFTEGFGTRVLQDAKALLDAIDGGVSPAKTSGYGVAAAGVRRNERLRRRPPRADPRTTPPRRAVPEGRPGT
jgi:DNA-binding winged helix-turn-helix (wHTH) protein/tetratricopeptide (TPR) repeat protein